MCGDVNIYFHEYIPEDAGEIEIMIAEKSSRRKGLASLCLKIMMKFIIENIPAESYPL